MRLKDKTAIVTGGSRGIGAAIALALADEGCKVAVAGRTQAALEEVAGRVRAKERQALAIPTDVTRPEEVATLFRQVLETWGKLDILVNNAGQSHSAPLVKVSLELWQRMVDVNLTATFLCSQAALNHMLSRKTGRIINIASTAAQIGYRYAGAYAAAKHGVLGLTRSMALETATQGITVNAVCPGWVESEMFAGALSNITAKSHLTEEQARAILAKESPQNRIFQPEEIAFAVVFLACDEARGITGQALGVSGGQVMH